MAAGGNIMEPTFNELDALLLKDPKCIMCDGHNEDRSEGPICKSCHEFVFSKTIPSFVRRFKIEEASGSKGKPLDNNTGAHGEVTTDIVQVNVEYLPVEVLMLIFKQLDDISVWSAGETCERWRSVISTHFNQNYWQRAVIKRWPLLNFSYRVRDWYGVYSAQIKALWCLKCMRHIAEEKMSRCEEHPNRFFRLANEMENFQANPIDGIQVKLIHWAGCHWQASIRGPVGSPYEGGTFLLYMQVHRGYPSCPPRVRFLTKIFHPFISRHGEIGINLVSSYWAPGLRLRNVLISIQLLLNNPFGDVVMEPDVNMLFSEDQPMFEQQARRWTRKYAMIGQNLPEE